MMLLALATVSCDATALSITLLHSLGQGDQNEGHDFFGHVMTLALVSMSHGTVSIVNGITTFLRVR